MRALIAVSILLACMSVQAAHLDYFSCRKWVEQECVTNTIPQDERLFVGRMTSPRFARIVHFRPGISLHEIIDQTPLKGKVVLVCVMRPDQTKASKFTRHTYIKVGPSDTPDFVVKSLDVIWLYDDGPIIET